MYRLQFIATAFCFPVRAHSRSPSTCFVANLPTVVKASYSELSTEPINVQRPWRVPLFRCRTAVHPSLWPGKDGPSDHIAKHYMRLSVTVTDSQRARHEPGLARRHSSVFRTSATNMTGERDVDARFQPDIASTGGISNLLSYKRLIDPFSAWHSYSRTPSHRKP
jgi:hypothetical protein